MIAITDKSKCCGCTACYSICPKKCIEMIPDEEGFLYPQVETGQCINCKCCENICPHLYQPAKKAADSMAYIARSKSSEVLMSSSSGGFFTVLCEYIIAQGGIVCGVAFDENWNVYHRFAETIDQCAAFKGSKYVQSEIRGVFSKVKDYLNEERLVCFSGTPCQVAGLKNYLNKEYNNLVLIDFVCHGVPSPLLWREYLKKKAPDVEKINFREKRYGYQLSGLSIQYRNKKKYFATARVDILLKSFFMGITLRYSCYNCQFKGIDRCSDFTVYDSWHTGSILNIKNDDKGYTNVIVRGAKGKEIMTALGQNLLLYQTALDSILPQKGGMVMHSAKMHKHRDDFYKAINQYGLDGCVRRFVKVTALDKAIERIKIMSYFVGIAPILSRVKKTIKKKFGKQ